jgi:hypothetical protein
MTYQEIQTLMNPYFTAGEGMDAQERMALRNGLVRQAIAEGLTLRGQLLYTRNGRVAGERVGLFDSAGLVEERFYTKEGMGDIRHALRTLYDVYGKAPIGW